MPVLPLSGLNKISQWLLTALFALVLSLLSFAGSFAEAPNSQYLPSVMTQR